jgi:3-hydroxyisobutyrate dehydrogenase
MKIGFIGLGLMGHPMAKNIVTKWQELFVWNRTIERTKELEKLGAKVCDTKKVLAKEVDILILMVTAGEDVEDILFGSDEIVSTLKNGSIIIDMSTIGVEWSTQIGERLSKYDIFFLDAPVTGSTPKAITGELTIFIWGEKEVFERAKPVLSLMGTNLQYMGPSGSGQAMKLINNALIAFSMIGLSEVMKLSETMGLPLERTAEVIKTLPVGSPYTAMKVDNFVRNEYPMMFSLANMHKDITLAFGEMEKHGLSLDMLSLAAKKYEQGVEEGYWNEDVSAIGKII